MNWKHWPWPSILIALSVLNVAGAGYAIALSEGPHAGVHVGLAALFWLWARRVQRRPALSPSELDRVQERLDEQAAALEDTRTLLGDQSRQLSELQERLDFTERVLTQARDRQTP